MEPVYYREALGWIRSHPIDWLRLEVAKGLLPDRADRTVLHVALGPILRRVGHLVRSGSAARGRRIHPPRTAAIAHAGALAPRGLGDRDVSDLFPAGAIQDSRHRSNADPLRERRVRAVARIGAAAGERPCRPADVQRAPEHRAGDRRHSPARLDAPARRRRRVAGRDGRDRRLARRDAVCRPHGGHAPHRTPRPRTSRTSTDSTRALATNVDAIGQMDADLSHDPKYLPDLRAAPGPARPRDWIALPPRRQRRELAAASHCAQRVREPLHPGSSPGSARTTARAGSGSGAARRLPGCRCTIRARAATPSSPKCSTRPLGAAAGSVKSRSSSWSGRRDTRRYRRRCWPNPSGRRGASSSEAAGSPAWRRESRNELTRCVTSSSW